jgi:hypothetical protein
MVRNKDPRYIWVAVVCLFVLLAPSLRAQTASTGALSGQVTDPSGAAIANVTVTAISTSTARTRVVMTGQDGTYIIPLLPLGTYSLKFEATGFNTAEVPTVTVNVTETTVMNRVLQVGTQNAQVVVEAEAEEVQTSNATAGDVVASTVATGLPLTTRNYTNLLGLSTGAAASVFNAATLGNGTTDIAVNGSSTGQNDVQMDGVSITNHDAQGTLSVNGQNAGLSLVNPDAIQEFKIQTSMFDAGYGRNPGANVNVVTKSGTNEFHGSAFEFFRNTALNANDFFRNQSQPINGVANNARQVLNQNQFGGVVGGPIKKDKLFFFASYQGTRQINGASAQGYSAPSLLPVFPGGDRSNAAALQASLGATFCPTGTDGGKPGYGATGTQVSCTGSNINPVAIALLQLKNPDGTYYVPSGPASITSSTGTSVGQATTFSVPARFREDQLLGVGDYVIDSKNTLSTHFYYSKDPTTTSFSCGASGGPPGICYPDTALTGTIGTMYGVLKLTSILTSHVVKEARFSVQRNAFVGTLNNAFTDSQVGIQQIIPQNNYLDGITVTGLFSIGTFGNLPQSKWQTDWEAADDLSWTHGKHTVRFGVEVERDRYNWYFAALADGALTFQTIQDFLLGLPGCAPGASNCATTTAAGLTNGTTSSNITNSGSIPAITPPGGVIHQYRLPFGDAYVQDDIKIKPQFTLNLGLRWEYDALFYDDKGLMTDIWPSLVNTVPIPGSTPATGSLAGFVVPSTWTGVGYQAPPVGGVYQNSHKSVFQGNTPLDNFAPRVGFAWSPLANNRLSVRGGAGYFYDRVGGSNYSQGVTQGQPFAVNVGGSGTAIYYSSFQQPYANLGLNWTPRYVNFGTGTANTGLASSNISQTIVEPNYRTPVVYEWNMFLQYEFASHWTFEAGYVGSHGIHQPYIGGRQINEAQLVGNPLGTNVFNAPGIAAGLVTTNTTANATLRVPYLGFAPAGLGMSQADTSDKFNSIQATLRKQFSHGFQAQAAYTFARAYTEDYRFNDPNFYVYGPNLSYHPQRLAISYLWNLPLGTHQGLLDKLTSGWGVSGVTIIQDGTPFTVTDTRGGTIYGFGAGGAMSTAEYCPGMGAANAASPGSVEQRLGGKNGGPGWFNPGAFYSTGTNGGCATAGAGLPPIGNGTGYGDSSVGILLGPGQFNWDMTLTKTTKVGGIREDGTLQFRTEFFNAFNHPQFNNPAVVDVSKSNAGVITTTSVNPRLIQFALKYSF